MQEVEMFSHIKMCPKGLSGNNGYIDSLDLQRTLCSVCSGSLVNCPGLSADCRIEPAVWHSNGLLSHSLSSLLYVFLSKLVLMNEEKSDAKILPSLEC